MTDAEKIAAYDNQSPTQSALSYGQMGGSSIKSAPNVAAGRFTTGTGGEMVKIPGMDYSSNELVAFDAYNDSLGFDWAGGLSMATGAIGTAMDIGSYFDTKKTNKLQRTALQGNIDEQANTRRDKDAFLGGTQSAFA